MTKIYFKEYFEQLDKGSVMARKYTDGVMLFKEEFSDTDVSVVVFLDTSEVLAFNSHLSMIAFLATDAISEESFPKVRFKLPSFEFNLNDNDVKGIVNETGLSTQTHDLLLKRVMDYLHR